MAESEQEENVGGFLLKAAGILLVVVALMSPDLRRYVLRARYHSGSQVGCRGNYRKNILLPGGERLQLRWCHPKNMAGGIWICEYPVTQAQWYSVMGNCPLAWKTSDLDVRDVSREECLEFCRKAGHGLRLPTDNELARCCDKDVFRVCCSAKRFDPNRELTLIAIGTVVVVGPLLLVLLVLKIRDFDIGRTCDSRRRDNPSEKRDESLED